MSEIVVSDSKISESGPGDLIVAINCPFHKRDGEKIYPGETDIPLMDFKDLPCCEKGFDCFQIPGSEDLICACKNRKREDNDGFYQLGNH